MNDPLSEIELLLEQTARQCLRLIVAGGLKPNQLATLAKWMFGCMNQRFTIRRRIKKRGPAELGKVLKFVGQACQFILELEKEKNEPPPKNSGAA